MKARAEVWSDHGPAGYTSCGSPLEPPMRARTKPRSPRLTMSWAYRWPIHASGVTPGDETTELSQHQSSHQKETPWR